MRAARQHLRLLLAAALLAAGLAFAACPAKLSPDGSMDTVLRRTILGSVWSTVQESYLYRDFGGGDWDKELRRYRVLVTEAETNAAFYRTVDDMILGLGDDHSIYLSPWEACDEDRLIAAAPEIGGDGFSTIAAPVASRVGPTLEVVYLDLPSFDSLDIGKLVVAALDEALASGRPDGLIVDLRRNPGGFLLSAYEVLAQFVSGEVGTEYDDLGDHPLDLPPGELQLALAKVPMVVLVDRDTASAAEIVAAVLQDQGRAAVVGQTTAGNTETVVPFDYLDGSRLWLAVGGFRLPDGSVLEGRGVEPDYRSAGADALELAVDLLLAP